MRIWLVDRSVCPHGIPARYQLDLARQTREGAGTNHNTGGGLKEIQHGGCWSLLQLPASMRSLGLSFPDSEGWDAAPVLSKFQPKLLSRIWQTLRSGSNGEGVVLERWD